MWIINCIFAPNKTTETNIGQMQWLKDYIR